MPFSASRIWSQAVSFFFRHIIVLAPLAPLLVVPFMGNAFIVALVGREQRDRPLQPTVAFRQALHAMPALVRLKLYYFWHSPWGLVRGLRARNPRSLSAMCSMVTVLENQTDFSAAKARCEELVDQFYREFIRVWRSSLLLFLPIILLLAVGDSSWIFWSAAAAVIWLWVPGSAAASTYLYLWIRDQEANTSSANPHTASSLNPRFEPTSQQPPHAARGSSA